MVRQMERLNSILIRHSEIVENEHALQIVQSRNWQYFIETLLHISNNELNEDSFDLKDDEAFEDYLIIGKTAQNLKYCKNFYEEVFDDIAYFLHKQIKETPDEIVEKMEEDLANEKIYYKRIKEIESHAEFLMIFNNFYFKTGRFPGNYVDLMVVPPGVKPSFVKSYDQISPVETYEKFKGGPSHGIAAVQFLAALHSFFGGDKERSRNVMSEFFSNLSLQALTVDDNSTEIGFDEIIELNRNLKSLIRDDQRNKIRINRIQEETFEEVKDANQLIEEEVVSNITNNVELEYPNDDNKNILFPNTPSEILRDREQNNMMDEKLERAYNRRDEEIAAEFVAEARKELIKLATGDGGETSVDILNTAASTFDLLQETKQDKDVRKHVQETIKKDNEQFMTKKKSSSVTLKISSPGKCPKKKITDLLTEDKKGRKKPYDKE